ncbi:DUF805 domain-containing protein [Sphingomonas canadensis]|uniref:DUF805 domain-containing protein n=1 Tax=Sphingomonas canadensis TaxID=1219257 RepID=A0ABW3H1K8_9SPHN|nr:DUF805 domain-containing protein [Sphingomonas canadensis]MCW3835343.1 DUF805 domain-containing protein [Sphingomonas canadensis]
MAADLRWGDVRGGTMPGGRELWRRVRGTFSFRGRACRRQYLEMLLWSWVIVLAAMLPADLLRGKSGPLFGPGDSVPLTVLSAAGVILIIPVLIALLATAVRRLHDQDSGAHGLFLLFLPVVGGMALFCWLMFSGNPGENAYGPDPRYRPRVPGADQP